jgi:hypothetical protein
MVELFKGDHAGHWVGGEILLLTVLDTVTFPAAVVGFRGLPLEGLRQHLRDRD